MGETAAQTRYRADAAVLKSIGEHLAKMAGDEGEMWLPAALAEKAAAAWERNEQHPSGTETTEQALQRGRAATLALIGLSVSETGIFSGDRVVVALDPTYVRDAIEAATDGKSDAPDVSGL